MIDYAKYCTNEFDHNDFVDDEIHFFFICWAHCV